MARHLTLPSFLSTKRSRVITAAAGTLTLATAISAAALTLPAGSSVAAAGPADVYVTSLSHSDAAQTAAQQAGAGNLQQMILSTKMGSVQVQHEREAATAKAAAAKAAAKAAAAKAAAAKSAAAKAAAAKAAEQAASAKQAAAQAAPATQQDAVATPSGSPQQIAQQMLGQFGWSSSQFSCLEPLWEHESGWQVTAENPSSGAYGIPQALPGSQMASAGPDWQTNAATQIKWGLTYIQDRYGSPCGAWAHEQADNWY